MKTIYKYELTPETELSLPKEHRFLDVQVQRGMACVWVLVDTETSIIKRTVRCYDTGQEITHHEGQYVGTFQLGALVFHAFALDD